MTESNMPDSNTWLEEHGDYLFRYAWFRLKDKAWAEDMVQDTLVSAILAKDDFSSKASIRTWLTSILKNKMVDYWRRQGREIAIADLMGDAADENNMDDFFDKAGHWADIPNAYPNPDSALESKQFRGVFEHCLSKLKPQQAEVFIAKEVHGMDNEEISKNYALSASNIWVLMHRARVSLGKCLEVHWAS
ncbi:MAG: sigma-70 family RNA polymerase sigma factor [Methylophilaceae bacterium]